MASGNKFLQIQGKVDNNVLGKLIDTKKNVKKNTLWLFVDYSSVEYKLNSKFDIVSPIADNGHLAEAYSVKLLDVIEQTGKKLPSIPQGYKTMCRFEFKPFPDFIDKLPVLSSWTHECQLKFALHEKEVDSSYVSKEVYTQVINDFISLSINTKSVNKKSVIAFLDTVSKIIHDNSEEMKNKISNPNLVEDFKKKELHIG